MDQRALRLLIKKAIQIMKTLLMNLKELSKKLTSSNKKVKAKQEKTLS